jgi:hypothetical protein
MQIAFFFGCSLRSQNNFFTVDNHSNSSVFACMHVEVCLFSCKHTRSQATKTFLLIEMTGLGMVRVKLDVIPQQQNHRYTPSIHKNAFEIRKLHFFLGVSNLSKFENCITKVVLSSISCPTARLTERTTEALDMICRVLGCWPSHAGAGTRRMASGFGEVEISEAPANHVMSDVGFRQRIRVAGNPCLYLACECVNVVCSQAGFFYASI